MTRNLYFINTVNMKEELLKQPKAYIQPKFGQDNSHAYSYLEARECYQKNLGHVMGLEKSITEMELRSNGSKPFEHIFEAYNDFIDSKTKMEVEFLTGIPEDDTLLTYYNSIKTYNAYTTMLKHYGKDWTDVLEEQYLGGKI